MNGRSADITGVILVGGKSRRMGRDKAFILFDGKPLFEQVFELFSKHFEQVVLAGDREERFTGYRLPVFPDLYPGSSLGGLYTGLYHATTPHIALASCDMPFPSGAVLRYLCSLRKGFDVVVPVTPYGYEPLFAIYAKTCLPTIKSFLEKGNYCAYGYYPQLRVREVAPEEISALEGGGRCFVNLNTPDEVAVADAGKNVRT